MGYAILGISIFFFLGHTFKYIFIKTKIPDTIFLMLLGLLLGPVLGLVKTEDFGKVGGVLSTIALIVILYEGGLELRTKELMTSALPATGLAIFTFLFSALFSTILILLFSKQTTLSALLVSVCISSTSPAIVFSMVNLLNLDERAKTILKLEAVLGEVLVIVLFMSFLEMKSTPISSHFLTQFLFKFGKSILLGLFLGVLWAFLKNKFPVLTDITFSGEAWALFTYAINEMFHFNGVLSVFVLGYTLSNLNLLPKWTTNFLCHSPMKNDDFTLLKEAVFLLRTFFFIYLGMVLQFSNIKYIILAFTLTILLITIRYLIVLIVLSKKRFRRKDALITTAMFPRGLACAVLAMIPLQRGLEGAFFIQETVFCIVATTIIFTAFLIIIIERFNALEILKPFFKNYPV